MVEKYLYNRDMVRSIYVSSLQVDGIEENGANHLIVSSNGLDDDSWSKLQRLGLRLGIAIDVTKKGEEDCPLDPHVQQRLFQKLEDVLKFSPEEIWFDRFRFGGDCTGIYGKDAKLSHQACKWCEGKDRKEVILSLAQEVKEKIGDKSKFGLFVVAFKDNEVPVLAEALGLDYAQLGQVIDLFSPMLYHRMLGKSVEYISDYSNWLSQRTGKPILPIIQIKDMPDDLEDKMSEAEITQAFNEAITEPSSGVCFFWWQHAIEKNKTSIISKLLTLV